MNRELSARSSDERDALMMEDGLKNLNLQRIAVAKDLRTEDGFRHVGLDHIAMLADASRSLTVIAALIFSICARGMLDMKHAAREDGMVTLYLALATAFSLYTVTYSLLEFYYAQSLKSADKYVSSRIEDEAEATPRMESRRAASGWSGEKITAATLSVAASGHESGGGGLKRVVSVTEEREALVEEVMARFSRFHDLRATSRNCMWSACFALLVAIIFHLDPFGTEEELKKEKYSPSFVTACFFVSCFICAAVSWCMIGFPVRGETAEFCTILVFCVS